MSTASEPNSHEDISPADFVKKIRALGEQRDREDAARFAQLEQDIAKGKEERAARRAERARSISPEKSFGAATPPGPERHATSSTISPRPTTESASMPEQDSSATSLARSGTLSWQQRPKSASGRRPLSFVAAENAARSPRATPEAAGPEDSEKSREDIAAALAAKDPTWFRQTADRGVGSAAYRRNQVEDPSVTEFTSGQRGLPGMSRSPPPDDIRSTSPSRQNSFRNSGAFNAQSNRLRDASPGADMKSPSIDPPTLNPPNNETLSRVPNRSPSPTKGMGGFVQSAMLKRSDSVNKRWSAQQSSGLSRQGSTASNRGGAFSGASSGMPRLESRSSTSPSRGNSAEPSSRPTSSHDNSFARPGDDSNAAIDKDGFARPALPLHTRSKSVASMRSVQSNDDDPAQPPSPSKRWSPTKSSWLESALNKPEEKAKPTPPPSQPSWMSDLARAKQQKNTFSAENSDPPQVDNPKATPKDGEKLFNSPLQKAKSPPPEPAAKPVSLAKEQSDPTPLRSTKSPSPVTSPKPAPKPDLGKSPESGKFDFRSNLKSRQTPSDANKDDEPEFRNALGKLKRTQTQKYEAPDVFRSNIMQGKAALNITGGPAPRVKKDELKDSLVQRKKEMQAKAASEGPKKPIEKPDLPTPEALARRKAMSKSESFQDPLEKPKEKETGTPEALSKFRSVREKAKPDLPQKPSSPPLTRKEAFDSPPSKDETPSRSAISRTSSNEDGPAKVNLFAGGLKAGASSKLADRFNPALAGMLARGPSPMGNQPGKAASSDINDAASTPRSQSADEPGPGRELTHMTKGRARGPKRKAPSTKTTEPVPESASTATQSRRLPSVSLVKPEHILPSSPKEITTASSRDDLSAKPKPLAPNKSSRLSQMATPRPEEAENVQPEDASAPIKAQTSGDRSPLQDQDSKQHRRVPSRSSPTKAQPSPFSSVRSTPMSVHEDDSSKRESLASFISPKSASNRWSRPTEPSETASTPTSRPWSTISEKEVPLSFEPTETSKKSFNETKVTASDPGKKPSAMWGNLGSLQRTDTLDTNKPASPKRAESPAKSRSPERHDDDLSNVSVKNAAAIWGKSAEPVSSPGRPKSPVKLPTKHDEEKAMRDAGLMPPPGKPTGLGITGSTQNTTRSTQSLSNPLSSGLQTRPDTNTEADTKERGATPKPSPTVTSPTSSSLQAPPDSPRPKTPDNRSRPASLQIKPPPESPIPHTSEANRLFTDFFDDRPIITSQPDFDTIALLEHDPLPTEKITTIRKQMQVVLGDGKLATVPQDQSHILYDDSMYVCSHSFSASNGSKSSIVYLWAGSNVPPAAVDDAQIFARRAARDVGGKLEVITQGKETPNFLQAVGGSLITFRGSASRSAAAIPDTFMLCGRRHLGQITFDEVDFSVKSFCSAYPYIVSKDGKLYLWKGMGCHSDELGCALLIAMELGMTPDNQMREGEEPASFLSLFGSGSSTPKNFSTPGRATISIPRSADHWRHKPRCDRYRVRLFRVSAPSSATARSSLQVSALLSSVTDGLRRKRSWSSLMPLSSPSRETPASPTASGSGTPTAPLTPNGTGRPRSGAAAAAAAAAPEFVVAEIAPFTQDDLIPGAVHVLDAFFEVYVLIGSAAQSQARAFAAALLFAQDYGILAASMEDRPFVPVSTVVLEGAPRDMKACFRQWKDPAAETGSVVGKKEGGVGGGKRSGSLRCVGLSAALAAARMESI